MNAKTRLLALKTMLSVKLYENTLVIIDTEKIDYSKTSILNAVVEPYGIEKLLFLVPGEVDPNFEFASRNLKTITLKSAAEFNLPELLRHDKVFMTK